MKTSEIKANVKYDWNHPNCKFEPGESVLVNIGYEIKKAGRAIRCGARPDYSRQYYKYSGQRGKVVAVSCAKDGNIRGRSVTGFFNRQYTRYYVEFVNGQCVGYHSHHLISEKEAKRRVKNNLISI